MVYLSTVLLDLTTAVPLINAKICRTSAVLRVRTIGDNQHAVLWSPHNLSAPFDPNVRHVVQLNPATLYVEGGTQKIYDFILSPPSGRLWEGAYVSEVSSFRVVSAIPKEDRPWQLLTYTILLHHGQAQARLMLGHQFVIDLPDYDIDSVELPPPPNTKPKSQEAVQTFWDRLLE